MLSRTVIALVASFTCLAASAQVAPPPDPLTEEFRQVLIRAHTVSILEVASSRVIEDRTKKWHPLAWNELLEFKLPVLYGIGAPEPPALVHATPRRGGKPAVRWKPGMKVIVAQTDDSAAAVLYSDAAVLATRRALAPGWSIDKGLLCPSCAQKPPPAKTVVKCELCGSKAVPPGSTFCRACRPQERAKCKDCGGRVAKSNHKFCATCGPLSGNCQACERKLYPATLHVALKLNYIDPLTKNDEPAELKVQPGQPLKLWVSVRCDEGHRFPSVPELACQDNKLETCPNLFFLVQGPGIDGEEIVAFKAKAPPAEPLPEPLTQGNAFAELELKVLPGGNAFKMPGAYTVRAVAERLVSSARTVIVTSQPLVKDGLAFTVTPTKTRYAHNESPIFDIEIKNVSMDAITIIRNMPELWALKASFSRMDPRVKGKSIWRAAWDPDAPKPPMGHAIVTVTIQPGKSIKARATFGPNLVFSHGPSGGTRASLPRGKYSVAFDIAFGARPVGEGKTAGKRWVGQVTSVPVNIELMSETLPSKTIVKGDWAITVTSGTPGAYGPDTPYNFELTFKNVGKQPMTLDVPDPTDFERYMTFTKIPPAKARPLKVVWNPRTPRPKRPFILIKRFTVAPGKSVSVNVSVAPPWGFRAPDGKVFSYLSDGDYNVTFSLKLDKIGAITTEPIVLPIRETRHSN